MDIRDIYFIVDSNVMKQGYWDKTIEEKKLSIEQELKKYIILKMNEIDENISLFNYDVENENLIDLLQALANMIPKELHFETLRHFVHYLLNIASNLQGWSIIWYEEENKELKNNPVIDFNEDGKWNSLTTLATEEDDYVKIFAFVNDVFQNQFMTNRIKGQKRIIRHLEIN